MPLSKFRTRLFRTHLFRTHLAALLLAALAAPDARSQELEIDERLIRDYREKLVRVWPHPKEIPLSLWEQCVASPAPSQGPQDEPARTLEALRKGPHANASVLVYASKPAVQMLSREKRKFPVGTVIVKEKIASPLQTHAVTGMVKRSSGYNPKDGDWEYFYWDAPTGLTQGKINNCVECHAKASRLDFVYLVEREKRAKSAP
jgi:hypothetical protein